MNTEIKPKSLELSEKEYRYILECLLNSCLVGCYQRIYANDATEISDLLIKMRSNDPRILVKNLNYNSRFDDDKSMSQKVLPHFPEIIDEQQNIPVY